MKEKIKFNFITLIAIGTAFLFEYMDITTIRLVFLVIAVRFPVS